MGKNHIGSLYQMCARHPVATATDLADYLVRKGLPFRDAHDVVGRLVAVAVGRSCDLSELGINELKAAHESIEDDVFDVLTLEGSMASRDHTGGTAPGQVAAAIERARVRLSQRD